jgi:hypothetical protein
MQQLQTDVGVNPNSSSSSPAALSFLANILVNNGAVQQAVQLYKQAVQMQPGCSSYALGLAHALELDYEYAEVLKVVLHYCEACDEECLGPLQLKVI